MTQGFYEILGVESTATTHEVGDAYHGRLAELVRRLRASRKQGADVTILESQERALREAMQVLSEPVRRQRYDSYRRACLEGIPADAESLWNMAKASLVDPVAISALDVLRTTTDLDIGNPFPANPQPRKWAARPPPPSPTPAPMASVPEPVVAPEPAVGPARVIEALEPAVEPQALPDAAFEPVIPEWESTEQVEAEAEAEIPLSDVPSILARYGTDGRFLRAVRELRHRQLETLAEETRISLRYLHAIESNDFESLPAATFVRGYVKELVRALDIDDVDVIEGYMALYNQQRG